MRHQCPKCDGDGKVWDTYMNPYACPVCDGRKCVSWLVVFLYKIGLIW